MTSGWKNPDQPFDYFDELMRRIQDIRTSERQALRRITFFEITPTDGHSALERKWWRERHFLNRIIPLVPAEHLTLLRSSHVKELAELIERALE